MSSNKKRFSLGWVLGISLGLACGAGAVYASSISQTYSTSTPVDTTLMGNVKTAVNDNDARITAIGAGTQTCLTGMTRVGPTCVDTARQAASSTWSAAVDTCRTANKRLLTPGEYMAAMNQNAAAFGMNTNGEFEWVDAVSSSHSADNTTPGAGAGRLRVGYMGPSNAVTGVLAGEIFFATNAAYDGTFGFIYYRCAR